MANQEQNIMFEQNQFENNAISLAFNQVIDNGLFEEQDSNFLLNYYMEQKMNQNHYQQQDGQIFLDNQVKLENSYINEKKEELGESHNQMFQQNEQQTYVNEIFNNFSGNNQFNVNPLLPADSSSDEQNNYIQQQNHSTTTEEINYNNYKQNIQQSQMNGDLKFCFSDLIQLQEQEIYPQKQFNQHHQQQNIYQQQQKKLSEQQQQLQLQYQFQQEQQQQQQQYQLFEQNSKFLYKKESSTENIRYQLNIQQNNENICEVVSNSDAKKQIKLMQAQKQQQLSQNTCLEEQVSQDWIEAQLSQIKQDQHDSYTKYQQVKSLNENNQANNSYGLKKKCKGDLIEAKTLNLNPYKAKDLAYSMHFAQHIICHVLIKQFFPDLSYKQRRVKFLELQNTLRSSKQKKNEAEDSIHMFNSIFEMYGFANEYNNINSNIDEYDYRNVKAIFIRLKLEVENKSSNNVREIGRRIAAFIAIELLCKMYPQKQLSEKYKNSFHNYQIPSHVYKNRFYSLQN